MLYAPGLRNLEEVRRIVRAVNRPVNVVTGWLGTPTLRWRSSARLAPSELWCAVSSTLETFVNAARAMQRHGSFVWMRGVAELGELFKT